MSEFFELLVAILSVMAMMMAFGAAIMRLGMAWDAMEWRWRDTFFIFYCTLVFTIGLYLVGVRV